MNTPSESLLRSLQQMPVPGPRPGFIDRAFAEATAGVQPPAAPVVVRSSWLHRLLTSWQTWMGVALGAAVAATLTVLVLRPVAPIADRDLVGGGRAVDCGRRIGGGRRAGRLRQGGCRGEDHAGGEQLGDHHQWRSGTSPFGGRFVKITFAGSPGKLGRSARFGPSVNLLVRLVP